MRRTPGQFSVHILLSLLLAFLVFEGCGKSQSIDNTNTGSIKMSVVWQGAPVSQSGAQAANVMRAGQLDCAALALANVEAKVYNSSNTSIASGGPWACTAHSGSLTNVPAGSNYRVVIIGRNSATNAIYRGEVLGITVIAGGTTDAGAITASVFAPVLSNPTNGTSVSNGSFSLQWSDIVGASYRIQIATDNTFVNLQVNTTTSAASYVPPTLTNGTYYWRVQAVDIFGNTSEWNATQSFIVGAAAGTYSIFFAGSGLYPEPWNS